MYQFTEDCLIGISQIDDEHRKLFSLINEAASLPVDARTAKTVTSILNHLTTYAATHFAHEEAYMAELRDPELHFRGSSNQRIIHLKPQEEDIIPGTVFVRPFK